MCQMITSIVKKVRVSANNAPPEITEHNRQTFRYAMWACLQPWQIILVWAWQSAEIKLLPGTEVSQVLRETTSIYFMVHRKDVY